MTREEYNLKLEKDREEREAKLTVYR